MRRDSGVSLIELLIAIVIVSGVVAMISVLFPKTSRSIVRNRQNTTASNLGAAKIEDMLKQPYAYIDPTAKVAAYFPSGAGIGDPGCDCSKDVNFNVTGGLTNTSNLSTTEVIPSTGTTYQRTTCVNYVTYGLAGTGGATTSHCPALGDTGTKYIRVRVSWTSGPDQLFIDQESVKARY